MKIVTAYEYDGGTDGGDGYLTEQTQYVTASDTRVTTHTYDFRGRSLTTDGEVDFFQQNYYDNLDRVVKTERYDTTSSGNLIARNDTQFDPRGRVYRTIRYGVEPNTGDVTGSQVDNTWFDAGLNVIQRQPSGLMQSIEFEYDSLGRLTTTTDPLSAVTVLAYDAASNRISLTDAEDDTTTWGYDGIGRVVKETNPLADNRLFEYDDAGNLSERTDRNGRVIEFDYDDAGRATEERWMQGGSPVNTLEFTYDPDSRIETAADVFSSYAYAYGLRGEMTEVDSDGTPGVPRVVLTSEYNRQMERTSVAAEVATTNDFLNDYSYDNLGRMSRIRQQSNGGATVASKRIDLAYASIWLLHTEPFR